MSSGFVTELEIETARKKRQEEWDKVRSENDPEEAPENPYDGRSLFDRLQEQKQKKDLEFDEAHKLKNMIRGLDDDEVDFLESVDRTQINAERKRQLEEAAELKEFRLKRATLEEKSLDDKLHSELITPKTKKTINNNRTSQKSILAGAIKRKTNDEDVSSAKKILKTVNQENGNTDDIIVSVSPPKESTADLPAVPVSANPGLQCIGILPGLGYYKDSSDSGGSTESDDEEIDACCQYDFVGRKICKNKDK